MKKSMVILSFLLILAMLTAGCAPKTEQPAASGGETAKVDTAATGGSIIIRHFGDPMSWNPDNLPDDNGYPIFQNIFNRLVKLDASKNIIPDLAKSWDISDDAKTITFHLRDNAKWHDGEKVTAKDVKYTFDHIKAKETYLMNSRMKIVDSIEAKDDTTVIFNLNQPDVSLVAELGWYATFILPEHVFNNGQEWEDNPASKTSPIGSGPFKLLEAKQGQHIILEKNPDYFEGAPALDKLIYTIIPDDATAVQALVNGEIDVLENVPASNAAELLNNPDVRLILNQYPSPMRLIFNMKDEKVKDVNLRKAISMAIDKEEISKKIYFDIQKPEYAMYPEFIKWASNTENASPKFNIEQAREIMEKAGYKADAEGFYVRGLEVEVFEGGGYPDAAKLMAATLAKAGIEMKINVSEFNAWADKVGTQKKYIMELQGGFMGPDPAQLQSRYGTDQANNWSNYSNPAFDELVKKAGQEPNQEERAKLYKEAQKILAEEAVFVPVVGFASYDANSVKFQNLPIDGAGKWGWQEYTFTKKVQ